jgi:hypothetical protein
MSVADPWVSTGTGAGQSSGYEPKTEPVRMSFKLEGDDCEVQAIGIILQVLRTLSISKPREDGALVGNGLPVTCFSKKESATRIIDFVKARVESDAI